MHVIHRYGKLILGVTAISALGVAFASTGSVRSYADGTREGASVIVANTASQPVPIAAVGTTQVAGTVAITNMPSVSLGGPVAVLPDARRAITLVAPFQDTLTDQFVAIDFVAAGTSQPYQVPAGQRFVLESVALTCITQTSDALFIQLDDVASDGSVYAYNLPSALLGTYKDTQGTNYNKSAAAMQYRAYFEAGHGIRVVGSRIPQDGSLTCAGMANGYTVDL